MKEAWKNVNKSYSKNKIISSRIIQEFDIYGEILFLIALSLVLFENCIYTTTLREIQQLSPVLAWMNFAYIGILWIEILISNAKSLNKLMSVMVCIAVSQMISGNVGMPQIMLWTLLILGASNVDFKKILGVYLITISGVMTVAFAMAKLGYVTDLRYFTFDRGFRYALGGIYPTDFMSHIFFLVIAFLYLIKEKINIVWCILLSLAVLGLGKLTDARTATYCAMLCIWGVLIIKKLEPYLSKIENHKFTNIIKNLSIWSMVIGNFIFWTIVLICNQKRIRRFVFPQTIASRIDLTIRAFREFGIPMWGSPVQMRGYGGKINQVKDYFFLDCSYVYILYVYGLVVLLLVFALFIALGYKYKKDWYMLVILFAIALDCTIEHHLTDISYNIFLVAILAKNTALATKTEQEKV